MNPTRERLETACRISREHLLAHLEPERTTGGFRPGRLSGSPLAAATAVAALAVADPPASRSLRRRTIEQMAAEQTPEGGWGDLPGIPPNLAATVLGAAAFALSADVETPARSTGLQRALDFLAQHTGGPPAEWPAAFTRVYEDDRSFAAPILMTAAAAGLLPWTHVPSLPLEAVLLPRAFYRLLRLQVVSYALPALIAVGWAVYRRTPRRAAARLGVRNLAGRFGLHRLESLQPESGGFLEAVPLTAFVVLALSIAGAETHPTVARGCRFLLESRRPDYTWPIDIDLNCWLTALSVAVLIPAPGNHPPPAPRIPPNTAAAIRTWLKERQWRRIHPYTGAAPGGWAWTDRDGGVPDADDTAAALIALIRLGERPENESIRAGVRWLLDLQNPDGGWPTFCRGWGRLPFDQSTPDITAHALRALSAAAALQTSRGRRAYRKALEFLRRRQAPDGSWNPLWFGSPWTDSGETPVYGTALVLRALARADTPARALAKPALNYLLAAQHPHGGWGAAPGVRPTIGETGAALTALAELAPAFPEARNACRRGAAFLADRVAAGDWRTPAPIGLYFAQLRYSERLYPILWTAAGLTAALSVPGLLEE